jgi:hypothetical protein
VPAPFAHLDSWKALPQFGVGIRFAGFTDANGRGTSCPQGGGYVGVDSVIVINNYAANDSATNGSLVLRGLDCVKQPTAPGQMNHYEIRISQGQIDVYGTDAGTTSPLKHLSTVANANLGFTRGLVSIEDVHDNADAGRLPSQRQHTFVWDNVAFDGPFTYRDLSFGALDANVPTGIYATVNLGKLSWPTQPARWNVLGMPTGPTAESARVVFNFYHYTAPTSLNVTVNGHAHVVPWAYPETQPYTWRTLAVTIPIADLVPATNVVTIGATDEPIVSSNVDIVLVNTGAGPMPVAPAPTSSVTGGQWFTIQAVQTLTLAWAANPASENVTAYELGFGTAPGVFSTRINVGSATSYAVTNLKPRTTYFFAVRAFNGQWGAFSKAVSGVTS